MIARIIAGPQGVDVRYVVTSYEKAGAKYLYVVVYCGRGEAELFIKGMPSMGWAAIRAPVRKRRPTQCRLLLHAVTYAIQHRFRSTVLKGTQWERMTFAEIRLRLFKIAGRLKVMKTKVRLYLPRALEASLRVIWERCVQPALP
ncbi:MAG: hypothetical protein ACI8T1_005244 [Verrucomicrobiales bacterium]